MKIPKELHKWSGGQYLRRFSAFWMYFSMLLMLLAVMSAVLIVCNLQFEKILTQTLLERQEIAFRQSSSGFEEDLYSMYSIPASIEDTENYKYIRTLSTGSLPNTYYPILAYLRPSLLKQCNLIGYTGESFLYFLNSNCGVSRSRCFPIMEDYFRSYVTFHDTSPDAVIETVKNIRYGITFLPIQSVSIGSGGASDYLLLFIRPYETSTVIGAFYSRDTVSEYFGLSTLPEDSYLILDQNDGANLANFGPAENRGRDAGYYEFTAELVTLRASVTLGIPKTYYAALLKSTTAIGRVAVIGSLLAGILLCVFFSHIGVRPVRKLVSGVEPVAPNPKKGINEFAFLQQYIRDSDTKGAALRSALISNILIRVFADSPFSPGELTNLHSLFPFLKAPCRVAVIREISEESPSDLLQIMYLLRETIPEPFYCEYINASDACILFEDSPETCDLLQRYILALNKETRLADARVVCGVSAAFTGLEAAGEAVNQAKICLSLDSAKLVVFYSGAVVPKSFPISKGQLDSLYQSIQLGDREAVHSQLHGLGSALINTTHSKEVYYSVLFVLRGMADGLSPALASAALEYNPTLTPAANFSQLEGYIGRILAKKRETREGNDNSLKTQITEHIEQNFSNGELCISMVADQLCVTSAFVQNTLLERKNQRFNAYLLSVRMKKAVELLLNTQDGVDDIARQCGYYAQSTFYRVFRKYYGTTPTQYRQTAQQGRGGPP